MSAWFYRFAQVFCRGIHLPARVHVHGRKNVPPSGPAILAANHISHFDPTLIATRILRPIDYIASAEFFVKPLPRAVLRGMNAFPIDRGRQDLSVVKESLRRLKSGKLVGIFVEGGIRHGATSLLGGAPINAGSLALAQTAAVPIVPAIILGADQLYQWRSWLRGCRVFIGFGPAFEADPHANRTVLARELEDRLRALAAEMRERYVIRDEEMPRSAQERWAEA
ncbi:MAG: lysophospholipid acyltransferase family protein [Verrucomicrobium sp.]|nr:lysophospholipid acyltransferase family protein [Verrucomicrobium sp.]